METMPLHCQPAFPVLSGTGNVFRLLQAVARAQHHEWALDLSYQDSLTMKTFMVNFLNTKSNEKNYYHISLP